ncbi:MAG: tripartite tricarboxylate transporter substrate binding protein [Betaproteobacteria bacterium]|nr:tripartite tricarboxylate transporter substrate binding protein [Betaproteobacteria bacterium]
MKSNILFAVLLSMGLVVLGATPVAGQSFPAKPIHIIASPPGGANDFHARLIGQGLNEIAGWQVIVDNRPSGGFIQGDLLMRSAPDGYTLLVAAGSVTIGPLFEKAPYEVLRDFAPVSLMSTAPSVLSVHPSLPVKSVKQLIALAKARPGELNFSTSGVGSANHLPAELFNYLARVKLVRINYRGAGPALTALISGEVHLMFATAASVAPHIKAKRVRALAITSAKPSALIPDLPTIAASGVPGYDYSSPWGLVAPAKTPPAIINRLNQEIVKVLKIPEIRRRFMNTGTEVAASTPEEYGAVIKTEQATWGKVIEALGLAKK